MERGRCLESLVRCVQKGEMKKMSIENITNKEVLEAIRMVEGYLDSEKDLYEDAKKAKEGMTSEEWDEPKNAYWLHIYRKGPKAIDALTLAVIALNELALNLPPRCSMCEVVDETRFIRGLLVQPGEQTSVMANYCPNCGRRLGEQQGQASINE